MNYFEKWNKTSLEYTQKKIHWKLSLPGLTLEDRRHLKCLEHLIRRDLSEINRRHYNSSDWREM